MLEDLCRVSVELRSLYVRLLVNPLIQSFDTKEHIENATTLLSQALCEIDVMLSKSGTPADFWKKSPQEFFEDLAKEKP